MIYRHIDGHHKLIRWRFVIHGGIDGYSRKIVYLHCSTNNRAGTVLDLFQQAVEDHGLPSRVHSDMGVENVNVAQFMIHNRGMNRRSVITGSAVHNQRIQRLWVDVKRAIVRRFQALFYFMEDIGILDPLMKPTYTVSALHLPLALTMLCRSLTQDWNHHLISSARNMSPHQIWRLGLIQYQQNNPKSF